MYVCQGCRAAGDALDAAIHDRGKKTAAGIKVRLIPEDDLKYRREKEREAIEAKKYGLDAIPSNIDYVGIRSLGRR